MKIIITTIIALFVLVYLGFCFAYWDILLFLRIPYYDIDKRIGIIVISFFTLTLGAALGNAIQGTIEYNKKYKK